MARSPRRQVTPPQWRVWTFGILGTAAAAALCSGWVYLCAQVWNWPVQVPRLVDSTDLVDASQWRVTTAVSVVGAVATVGASALARTVIGPRVWWLIIATGLGFTSLYGVLTLPGTDLVLRLRLSALHILVMVALIPALAVALRISDEDVARTLRAHESASGAPSQVDQHATGAPGGSPAVDAGPVEQAGPNDTRVLPLDD